LSKIKVVIILLILGVLVALSSFGFTGATISGNFSLIHVYFISNVIIISSALLFFYSKLKTFQYIALGLLGIQFSVRVIMLTYVVIDAESGNNGQPQFIILSTSLIMEALRLIAIYLLATFKAPAK
jgi:hypothetical protein